MALVQQTSAGAPRQIAVNINSGGVVYTVPTGKSFTGYVTSGSTSSGVSINGVPVYCTGGGTVTAAGVIPLSLVAGTVVSGLSQAGALIGTEQ